MNNNAEEKLSKAKRQLLWVGVICITVVVVTLWLVNLQRTLARNRERYATPPSNNWTQFREQFNNLWQKKNQK